MDDQVAATSNVNGGDHKMACAANEASSLAEASGNPFNLLLCSCVYDASGNERNCNFRHQPREFDFVDITGPSTAIFTHLSALQLPSPLPSPSRSRSPLPVEQMVAVSTEATLEETANGQSADDAIDLAGLLTDLHLADNDNDNDNDNDDEHVERLDDSFIGIIGDNNNDADALLMAFIDTGTFRARGGADRPRITNARGHVLKPKATKSSKYKASSPTMTDYDMTDNYLAATNNAEDNFIGQHQQQHEQEQQQQMHSEPEPTRLTFNNWLSAKKKKLAKCVAERRMSKRDTEHAAEQRRHLAGQKYNEWLANKARQAREALLARCAIASQPILRQRQPHEYLTEEEMRERVDAWEQRKIIESEQKRERKKMFLQAQRDYIEQRRRQAQHAWENWLAAHSPTSSWKAKSRSSKSVSSIDVNSRGGWPRKVGKKDSDSQIHYGHINDWTGREQEQVDYQDELQQHLAYLDQQYEQRQQQQQHEYEQYSQDSERSIDASYDRGGRHRHRREWEPEDYQRQQRQNDWQQQRYGYNDRQYEQQQQQQRPQQRKYKRYMLQRNDDEEAA